MNFFYVRTCFVVLLVMLPIMLLAMKKQNQPDPFGGINFSKVEYRQLSNKFGTELFDAKDGNGNTCLHRAAGAGNAGLIRSLLPIANLQGKLDQILNIKNEKTREKLGENTPLHLAVRNGHLNVVCILLGQSKIKVDVKNQQKQTPLDLAKAQANNDQISDKNREKYRKIVYFLIIKSIDFSKIQYSALFKKFDKNKDAIVQARSCDDKSILELAAEAQNKKLLEKILKIWPPDQVIITKDGDNIEVQILKISSLQKTLSEFDDRLKLFQNHLTALQQCFNALQISLSTQQDYRSLKT